jgi:hypothetical protein
MRGRGIETGRKGGAYAAFWTFPFLMQDVQTRIRLGAPFTMAWTSCRLMFQRRFVKLWAWLTRLPNWGPRPQTSHTFAISRDTPATVLLQLVYHYLANRAGGLA